MHSVTIHIGAARWGATVETNDGPVHYDFSKMNRDQRNKWYGTFMGTVRRVYGRNKGKN